MDHTHIIKYSLRIGTTIGLIAGILYSVGGLFIDLTTTGLNYGTLLAFGALFGMPAIGLVIGLIIGLIITTIVKVILKLRK